MGKNNVKKTYESVDWPGANFAAWRLLKPPFRGLIFCFKQVHFGQPNDDETVNVKFSYDILENKIGTTQEQMEMPEFSHILGEILMDILEDNLGREEKKLETVNNEELMTAIDTEMIS